MATAAYLDSSALVSLLLTGGETCAMMQLHE